MVVVELCSILVSLAHQRSICMLRPSADGAGSHQNIHAGGTITPHTRQPSYICNSPVASSQSEWMEETAAYFPLHQVTTVASS